MRRGALLLLLALGSCASHQYFRPRETTIVQSPAGYPAARYTLEAEDKSVGRINVWSRGAWREERAQSIRVMHAFDIIGDGALDFLIGRSDGGQHAIWLSL